MQPPERFIRGEPVLRSLRVENFTVFPSARLRFVRGLNVILGENGTGKTHLLKLPYAVMAVSADECGGRFERPTKAVLQTRIADKIFNVFRPEERVGRLARRQMGRTRCEVRVNFQKRDANIGFNFASQNRSEVVVDHLPRRWHDTTPVFLPTRELLTIYPRFVALYDTRHLEFDETWRDTCQLLGAPTLKGPRSTDISQLLTTLERLLGGQQVLERNDRFYLWRPGLSRMEMPLVAEGWRKVAMLARLIATGSLRSGGCLFWDEPEANLNPRLLREIAEVILGMCEAGVQVIIATHSLFLLREFELLLQGEFEDVRHRFFALQRDGNDVELSQGDELEDVDPITVLDEELGQSDRFVQVFS